ncbi:MAG: hypothetical protein JOZ39_05470 [Chloroflexi bacterium]|nr:hypothetical protein [Chloroflexota bacterium]
MARINAALQHNAIVLAEIGRGELTPELRGDVGSLLEELRAVEMDVWNTVAASDRSPFQRFARPLDDLVEQWSGLAAQLGVTPAPQRAAKQVATAA